MSILAANFFHPAFGPFEVRFPQDGSRVMKELIVKDAATSGPMRTIVILLCASNVIVGQTLPLIGSRPTNPIVKLLEGSIHQVPAFAISGLVGVALILSTFSRRFQVWPMMTFAMYKLYLCLLAVAVDPYAAVLFFIYAIAGVFVAASSRIPPSSEAYPREADRPATDVKGVS